MRGKWAGLGAAAVLLGIVAGIVSMRMRRPVPAPVAAPVSAPASRALVVSGVVRPQRLVSVSPASGGIVQAIPVEAGQEVYQGEVLARVGAEGLESMRDTAGQAVEQAQKDIAQAEGRVIAARLEASRAAAAAQKSQGELDRARKIYERQKMLNDAGATPRLAFQKAEQEYQATQQDSTASQEAVKAAEQESEGSAAALANARKELTEKTTAAESAQLAYAAAEVRSPVDGMLFAIHAEVGKNWAGGGAMFEIGADLERLEVSVEVPTEERVRLRAGSRATVEPVGDEAKAQPASVRDIQGNQVIVEFHNAMPVLKPGVQAVVRFKIE